MGLLVVNCCPMRTSLATCSALVLAAISLPGLEALGDGEPCPGGRLFHPRDSEAGCVSPAMYLYLFCLANSGAGKTIRIEDTDTSSKNSSRVKISIGGKGVVIGANAAGAYSSTKEQNDFKHVTEAYGADLPTNCKHISERGYRSARTLRGTASCKRYCDGAERCFPEWPKGPCMVDCEAQVQVAKQTPGCLDAEEARASCLMSLSCDGWRRHIDATKIGGPLHTSECTSEEVAVAALCMPTPDADACRRSCAHIASCQRDVAYAECAGGCGKIFMNDAINRPESCFRAHIAFRNCASTLTCGFLRALRENGGRTGDLCVTEARDYAKQCLDREDPTRADLGGATALFKEHDSTSSDSRP